MNPYLNLAICIVLFIAINILSFRYISDASSPLATTAVILILVGSFVFLVIKPATRLKP